MKENVRLVALLLGAVAAAAMFFWPRLSEEEHRIVAAYAQSYEVNSSDPDARRTDCQGRRSSEDWAALELTCERRGEVVARVMIAGDGSIADPPPSPFDRISDFDASVIYIVEPFEGAASRLDFLPEQ